MAIVHETEDVSATLNRRLRSIRLIELSDHMIRLNRRENTQLDLRLRRLDQQKIAFERRSDRDIYCKRVQLAQIFKTLDESSVDIPIIDHLQRSVSFYAVKTRRNQSAPPATRLSTTGRERSSLRPSTTPTFFRGNKRAMSIFKEITLKPSCPTLSNLLVLLDNKKINEREKSTDEFFSDQYPKRNDRSARSSTILRLLH